MAHVPCSWGPSLLDDRECNEVGVAGARQLGTVSRRQIDLSCRSFAHSPVHAIIQNGYRSVHFSQDKSRTKLPQVKTKMGNLSYFRPPVPELEPDCGKMCAETRGLHFSVGASAFMRGKERFSGPGKARLQSMRFSAGLFMTARSFWCVILSDERSEESKEPYGRQPSQTCAAPRGHTVISRSYRGPSTPRPPDPQKKRVRWALRSG